MFRVVTVSREYGSGGAAIARRIAERLGWTLLDRGLIEAAAFRAHVDIATARRYDETVDSWWHRMNRPGLWSAAVASGVSPGDAQFFDAETMASLTQDVIQQAASEGNYVVVGRGAQCVLRNRPEVFHVFVYGSWAERIARIQERLGTDRDTCELLRSSDRIRAAYLRWRFGCDWKDPHLYDIMISSQLGIEKAASLIAAAVLSEDPAEGRHRALGLTQNQPLAGQ